MKKILLILLCLPLLFTTCKKEDEVPTIPTLLGCTDSTACNYDYSANTDNGSCLTDYGCTDEGALNYDLEATCDDGSCTYPLAIGQYNDTLGGRIFYLDGNGGGLVVQGNGDGAYSKWGCYGLVTGADGTAIGTGAQNTIDIQSACSNTSAASICVMYEGSGHSDWFLPSIDELFEIYLNLHLQGVGNFHNSSYWSSSEFEHYFLPEQSGKLAHACNFANGNRGQNSKNEQYFVCYVRAF